MKIGNVSVNVDEVYKMGKVEFLKSVNNTTVDKEIIWSEIERLAKKDPSSIKKPSRKLK